VVSQRRALLHGGRLKEVRPTAWRAGQTCLGGVSTARDLPGRRWLCEHKPASRGGELDIHEDADSHRRRVLAILPYLSA
jgi:hypothetical protein